MEQTILQELVNGILTIMSNQVNQIILYGSFARGTNTDESDVDIALIMNGYLNSSTESLLSDFIVDMNLKYDKVFSLVDIDFQHFSEWGAVSPFYRNVQQEGIVLWQKAA